MNDDVFSFEIDTDLIKEKPSVSQDVNEQTIERIKEISVADGYRSDEKPKREVTIKKSFTMYPSEAKSISQSALDVMNKNPSNKVSDSEVVRAALHIFKSLSLEQKIETINDLRNCR